MKELKKYRKLKIVLISALIILLFISCLAIGYFYYKTSKMKRTSISKNDSDLGISKDNEKYKDIVNIALFGLDSRVKNESSRSDCIMILTIDGVHNKMKISSVMRDTYVNIDGHGKTKITEAYGYGGPQLAIKTLNENFGLNIKDFVKVDFFSLEKIIDSLGGLNINVNENELKSINESIYEASGIEKVHPEFINKPGLQLLNGLQAVAYCRVRHASGDDFMRTQRQRVVLELMLNKIKAQGSGGLMNTINVLLPYVETSINNSQLLKYCISVVSSHDYSKIEQERFPVDGYCWGATIKGIWYLDTDLNTTALQMQNYIFKDIKPVPKTPLVQ